MTYCRWLMGFLAISMIGCDGNDADRLNRVGKKVTEKAGSFADRMNLPRIQIQVDRNEAPVKNEVRGGEK
jgi:hypothetical protein